ncbi:hypothetical protein CCACVL1_22983 [Corchorus capsularis]|uniref:Uncharacterized protein n=1 Tax=Corchorus capsularis TaxID=210143 RepID=A0A1R3GVP7_COCAP|nr:hypothetical protein CCACVL1_22983 [Corchorus capsularis]
MARLTLLANKMAHQIGGSSC